MDTNDESGNAGAGEENFAELFEQSMKHQAKLEAGQAIEAQIVQISADWIFLDLGGKGEGYLDRKELLDPDGNLTVQEGDRVRAYFLSSKNNEHHFTTKIGSGPGKRSQLEDAWRNGIPVEGTVVKEVKGGFEVKVAGTVRAFCPFSQMGVRRDQPQTDLPGKTLAFMIGEYGENGRNIVLTRRPILEQERRAAREALQAKLSEGMRVRGRVTSIQKFGAFVDIGGVEGLLPVSELAWSRTEKVSDLLSAGQEVEVVIKKLDWENDRYSFSLKDALPDPWEEAAGSYLPGSYHRGTVARLAPFGAFVTLREGVDGLIHISKLGGGRRIGHPREVLKEGQEVEVQVEAVDREKRKVSLALAEIRRAEEEEAATLQEFRQQENAAPQNLGSLGELLKAKLEQKRS